MAEINSRKWERVLFVGIAIIVVAGQWYFWNNTTDDAFILFRYAVRALSGEGLTFNPGEHVEGYSSPLWLLLISGLSGITLIPPPTTARVLGIICQVGVLYCSSRIFEQLNPERRIWASTLFFFIIILTPGFHYFAGAGLETMLLAFLLTFGVWSATKSHDLIASIAFGLAGITRPEGVLYILAWLIWKWIYRRSGFGPVLGLSIIFTLGWEIFRIQYYGTLLPNTGIAKPWRGFGDLGFAQMARFGFAPIVAIIPLFFARKRQFPNIVWNPMLSLLFYLCVAGVIFVIYAGSDWMFFGRFVIPFLPIASILSSVWIVSTIPSQKYYLIVLGLVLICQCISWTRPVQRYLGNDGFAMLMKSKDPLRAAEWVHAHYPSPTTLATDRLGAISYVNLNFTVWDFAGLTDREEALFRKDPDSKQDPILARHPMLIAETNVPTTWNYKNDTGYYRWLSEHYTLVYSVEQGHFGSLDLWQQR